LAILDSRVAPSPGTGVGRILVSAAYYGGTTVADATNPRNTVEIGWYEARDGHP
jgi:hypothetical protein